MHSASPRHGTILIIVAGICALLATLSLAFLSRMHKDTQESESVIQYAQAKIMLAAACNYIQETSRIGWDNYPSTPNVDGLNIHEEAYGWIDVRDGSIGPKRRKMGLTDPDSTSDGPLSGKPLYNVSKSNWPNVGGVAVCPMYRMKRPPYSTSLKVGHNLMVTDNPASPDYCYPLLKNPDPRPAQDAATYALFETGDRTPEPDTFGKAWFRVLRDGPGTFIATCGAGGSGGYRNWSEIPASIRPQFNNDPVYFESLRSSEIRLHYRLEWTAAVTEVTYHNLQHEIARATEHYETWPPNASHTWSSSRRTQTWMKNPVGTIRWIQRLLTEPTHW